MLSIFDNVHKKPQGSPAQAKNGVGGDRGFWIATEVNRALGYN